MAHLFRPTIRAELFKIRPYHKNDGMLFKHDESPNSTSSVTVERMQRVDLNIQCAFARRLQKDHLPIAYVIVYIAEQFASRFMARGRSAGSTV